MPIASTPKFWQVLLRDVVTSCGLSLLIVSPYFLEKVINGGYFAFNIFDYFLIPHLESVIALGLLLYCAIRIGRHFALTSRWILIPIATLLIVFTFRGFFSAAGIPPQVVASTLQGWLSLISPSWLNAVTFRRIGVLALFVVGLIFLIKFVRDTRPLFRACIAFGWMLGVLTIIRIVPMLITENNFAKDRQQITHQSEPLTQGAKRVVWVIFDELDYNRTFLQRDQRIALPNLDLLRHQSVFAENAVSPAWMTSISIPALTTGTYLTETVPTGPAKLLLKSPAGTNIEWQNAPSIFSRLHETGREVDILGFYHPYCNIFPYANPCSSMPSAAYHVWWWGIWEGFRSIPGVDQLAREFQWTNANYDSSTLLQLDALESHLSDKSTTLSFIHFNIPHLPGGRVHGIVTTPMIKALPGYEQNLLTVDWMLGKIVKNLEAQVQSRDTLLIVSSDHWLRTKYMESILSPGQTELELGVNSTETHTIPLLIRHMSETSGQVISQPISTIYTQQLIEDFLDGKLSDHANIATWWQNRAFVAPFAP